MTLVHQNAAHVVCCLQQTTAVGWWCLGLVLQRHPGVSISCLVNVLYMQLKLLEPPMQVYLKVSH